MKDEKKTSERSKHTLRLLKLLAKNRNRELPYKISNEKYIISVSAHKYRFCHLLVAELCKKGFLSKENNTLSLTQLGLEKLKLLLNPDNRQNINLINASVKVNEVKQQVVINTLESPLHRLYCRKGKDGKTFISHDEFQAGERLRRDFERGQLQPKISATLNAKIGGKSQSNASEISDFAIDARDCVHKAMDYLGPELSSVTLDVCCFLKGLELVERERKWPPRSAKLMLKTSLSILARHYGITAFHKKQQKSIYAWGAQDYRPKLI